MAHLRKRPNPQSLPKSHHPKNLWGPEADSSNIFKSLGYIPQHPRYHQPVREGGRGLPEKEIEKLPVFMVQKSWKTPLYVRVSLNS